ncbi:hypothetical protein SPHINGOAX6_20049 [Sphingomonas sp. AX6]|nr:hypothetical protein SPHINGOAX6_20049 [Sphingomonas sp. AX6]
MSGRCNFRGQQLSQIASLCTLLFQDQVRRAALEAVAALNLPDCWIGAGFVRDAVWDHLHGYGTRPSSGDVVWFGPAAKHEDMDQRIERQLGFALPDVEWSVKIRRGCIVATAMRPIPLWPTRCDIGLKRRPRWQLG